MATPAQINRKSQAADKEKLPTDGNPGVGAVHVAPDPVSEYTRQIAAMSRSFEETSAAYANKFPNNVGPNRKRLSTPIRVISPDGFPPDISVTYLAAPIGATSVGSNIREVKHFVMHSFGHMWHATQKGDRWMNSTSGDRGVIPEVIDGKTVYVARGSTPGSSQNFKRFAAGLRACTSATARATAHFFIDREGNLVCIGDCNMLHYTSGPISRSSCGVEMEEAFSFEQDTKSTKSKAVWKPGGNPAGTAGNVTYLEYNDKMMLTLSVLLRKLETAYPRLKERNLHIKTQDTTHTSSPGYTGHSFVAGAHHMDVSPHFLEEAEWAKLFALVDSHEHITEANVFLPPKAYTIGIDTAVLTVSPADYANPLTAKVVERVQADIDARKRAGSFLNRDKTSENNAASAGAQQASDAYQQQGAVFQENYTTAEAEPTGLPAVDQPVNAQGVTINTERV